MINEADQQLRVFVIEDDPDTCSNLCQILELNGYCVAAARTAAEALAASQVTCAAVILLDRHLPDATAEHILPKLKQFAPQAEILVITGHADLDSAIAALRFGAADYLLKPINPEMLRVRLQRIAQQRQRELELQHARQQTLQSERLAAIGKAMTGLTHESRNALQRSQAGLEMLARRLADRPDLLKLTRRIQKAHNDLHQLYEEVRDYAAPIHLDRQPGNLTDLLNEVWNDLAPRRKGTHACLRQHSTIHGADCHIDRFGFRQVFRNILENALEACSEPIEIEASITEVECNGRPGLRIALRDNGPGLGSETRERIFDEFYTTKTRGTGLGMAISRRIVEAHQGGIELGDGPGTEIILTLPRTPAPDNVSKSLGGDPDR